MKLNLGCGKVVRDGWIGVDKIDKHDPDQVVDLEVTPWPWPTDSVEAVEMTHILEHLGQTPQSYLSILSELYRVCKDGATIRIAVPHHRHDIAVIDPTHVRLITVEGLKMFSKAHNENTRNGVPIDVDFEMTEVDFVLDGYWRGKFASKEITAEELDHASRSFNNVILETNMLLTVRKGDKSP